ncbi:ribulose-phosphate 3-epimerase [Clavibacter sepedonicus]|uniref:Sugar-phosphate epimerase n=1 Tax=Clavibacter sepedonicus TaxID=31964 RepID=B0RG72_CLASE|nr:MULTISPECIES: sugar-phosphate epimerase [Clavibacter]MBD5383323.1 hypothetical protein [Clavibacter sp.]OQJ47958.1 hypothetical protein B5P19_06460 [Clavibacter sepedonicus]OQJ53514.1 hypothetical protein B5P20_04715 [Clavibacter sepedonicus]UUK66376.1 hypothetical protein LRE50_03925 [Clavibacter sepedonicus]CAQ02363.1 putative sugar-phosphate epimerase [Clavibacter sepedonicus]
MSETQLTFSVSVVCINQTHLWRELTAIRSLGVSRLHIDIIDPSFGNLGMAPESIRDLSDDLRMPVDVHVMVAEPSLLVPKLVDRGAQAILVHQRHVTPEALEVLRAATVGGTEVGLVLDASESPRDWLIDIVRPQRLVVMAVTPGGAGRPFRREALDTVRMAAEFRGKSSVESVEVDGAVSSITIGKLVDAGADSFVLGSSVFPDRVARADRFLPLLEAAGAADGERVGR